MGSYLQPEPLTYINIKLTDIGRQKLSLGKLNFSTAVLSDAETNYGIDRTGNYDLSCGNRILSPVDAQPGITTNYDGSAPLPLQSIGSATQYATASTESIGFFSGTSNQWLISSGLTLGYSVISYSAQTPGGTSSVQMTGGTHFPSIGELMFVIWNTIDNSGVTYSNNNIILSANPSVSNWYRVLSADTSTSLVTLDRNLPDFGVTDISSSQKVNAYFYPFNGVESYYGSGSSVDCRVWNMNIVRTSSEIGTDAYTSGYTTYGSIEFNGTKQLLGFSSETKNFGIVHYTNNFTGNTLAEQLIEGSVVIDLPYIMWHRSNANVGQAINWGLNITDSYGPNVFDNVAQTTYRPLRDGSSNTSLEVGRVYHKLKIIVITDQELLTALTYKSNRNYTLPQLTLDTTLVPKYPLSVSDATGILQSGYSYYVTYVAENDYTSTSGLSYGYPKTMPCTYYSKIDGTLDSNGDPQYLKVNFPINSFPFMRSSTGMNSYSGTGWSANKVQLLVNKVNNSTYPFSTAGSISTDNWKLISTSVGNGIYSGGSSTIDPLQLQGFTYIVSQEDYDSGSTYSIASGEYSAFTQNSQSLTFGDEYMFFGNINTSIKATVFKTILTAILPDTQFNTTLNPTFDNLLDSDVYLTEVGVLDTEGSLVAVGKPTEPIKKNASRYLVVQLEIDF